MIFDGAREDWEPGPGAPACSLLPLIVGLAGIVWLGLVLLAVIVL